MMQWFQQGIASQTHSFSLWWQGDDGASYDRFYLTLLSLLVCIGVVMVSSASMPVAERLVGNPLYYAMRHLAYVSAGIFIGYQVLRIPIQWWHDTNLVWLGVGLLMLIAVLLVGREVKGSTRWIALGPINVQAAEPAKLFFCIYIGSYLVRRHDEVRDNVKGFLKPMAIMVVFASLLLQQPDLGTVIVLFAIAVALLFLAGAKLWQFIGLLITGLLAIMTLAFTSEYRWRRVTSFLDPWQHKFGDGYQLTQSLMAFGRGGLEGQGLGNSVQKLEYLPEAHTDFIVAVIAEETGLIGVTVVMALLFMLFIRGLLIGKKAIQKGLSYHGFLAYAIATWFGFQTFVNLGVASGVLPTKGLTLPFISYGGSSLIIMFVAAAIVLRIDFEVRLKGKQAIKAGLAR